MGSNSTPTRLGGALMDPKAVQRNAYDLSEVPFSHGENEYPVEECVVEEQWRVEQGLRPAVGDDDAEMGTGRDGIAAVSAGV